MSHHIQHHVILLSQLQVDHSIVIVYTGKMSHRHWDINCKIYVGGLREDANRYDLEDVFLKYGPVRDVWVARRPPGELNILTC